MGHKRVGIGAAVCWLIAHCAMAQPTDPTYGPLAKAYNLLRAHDYDAAIATFLEASAAAPKRPDIRKYLAYA